MKIFPSKKQWADWSMPSKYTFVGTFVGIIGLILGSIYYFAPIINSSMQKTSPPNILPSIVMLSTKYKPGLKVDGVTWRKDFENHILKIENKSKDTECYDLRVDLELPGAIIDYKVHESRGTQDITFSKPKLPAGISDKYSNLLKEDIEYYTNNLSINVAKMFPVSEFSTNIILSQMSKDFGGTITLEYRYKLSDDEIEKRSFVYPIKFIKNDSNQLHIDIESPIIGTFEGRFIIESKAPVIFGSDGTVRIKE
jgi:hypothetical protein